MNNDQRNTSIDIAKGILMITIIISNFLHKNPILFYSQLNYILYSFHIPLMLAIGGFLISEKTWNLSFKDFTKKYFNRILLSYFIAFTVYYILFNYNNLGKESLIHSIIHPMFHLWFVPNFIFSIYTLWLLKHIKLTDDAILIVGMIITIFFMMITVLIPLLSKYKPYYFIFFTIGYYIHQNNIKTSKKIIKIMSIIAIIAFIIRIILMKHNHEISKITSDFIFLNIVLSIFLLLLTIHYPNKKNNILQFIGQNSYPIYLWHPLIATIIAYTSYSIYIKWILGFGLEVLLLYLIYQLRKIRKIRIYIFGEKK